MPDLNNNINIYIIRRQQCRWGLWKQPWLYRQNICAQLDANGLHAREYKRDIAYKESMQQFMDDIASVDYIVLLISDKYPKVKILHVRSGWTARKKQTKPEE